jgi:integrase
MTDRSSKSGSTPKLLGQVQLDMHTTHYSPGTEAACVAWIRRFGRFHGLRHPGGLGEREVAEFLTHLATVKRVAASTQTQALSALLFLYNDVLRKPLGDLGRVIQAKGPVRLPVVLTRAEVWRVLEELAGVYWLVGTLLYVAGLRLNEAVTLRVKDVDFERGELLVRRGWGRRTG